jgi:protein SCO1/2
MKTKQLFCYTAIVLLSAMTTTATELSTNTVHRSCCQSLEPSVSALPEKSLYQLETVWTNDNAEAVKLSSLKGRPQVVVMFFASCQYTCPLLVYQVKQLEAQLPANLRGNVGFTLVSFDSKRDTPAALKTYRVQHELSRENWTLLRGDADSVLDLAALLGVKFKEDAQGQFSHSNVITLLNADGEIVYQQLGMNPENQEMIRQIEKLGAR